MAVRRSSQSARKTVRRQRFPFSSLYAALDRSIRNAKDLTAGMSATVAAARALAKKIDAEQVDAKPTEFLAYIQYCRALGFTIDSQTSDKGRGTGSKPKQETPLQKFLEKRKEG